MPASPLRVYVPAECDERMNPLDWEKCRACSPTDCPGCGRSGSLEERAGDRTLIQCEQCDWTARCACDRHGSIRAAALAALRQHDCDCPATNNGGGPCVCGHAPSLNGGTEMVEVVARCEGCGHPASEGTWEGYGASEGDTPMAERFMGAALAAIVAGVDTSPATFQPTYYSLCDAGCRHDLAATQVDMRGGAGWESVGPDPLRLGGQTVQEFLTWCHVPVRASWRHVDVCRLYFPNMVRLEDLRLLCFRCWAAG